jgi:hypothetical protein
VSVQRVYSSIEVLVYEDLFAYVYGLKHHKPNINRKLRWTSRWGIEEVLSVKCLCIAPSEKADLAVSIRKIGSLDRLTFNLLILVMGWNVRGKCCNLTLRLNKLWRPMEKWQDWRSRGRAILWAYWASNCHCGNCHIGKKISLVATSRRCQIPALKNSGEGSRRLRMS